VNQLPDIVKVGDAVIHFDAAKLTQAAGSLIVKSTCPGCEAFATLVMDKKDKAFVEQLVGRGWILYVTGGNPVFIAALADKSEVTETPLNQNSAPLSIPEKKRGVKTYSASPAICAVASRKSVTAGWVDAPVLTNSKTGERSTYPNVDLIKGDIVVVTSTNDCAAGPKPQRLVSTARFNYSFSSTVPGSPTNMKYFLTGIVKK
jgi:hypothetical protein